MTTINQTDTLILVNTLGDIDRLRAAIKRLTSQMKGSATEVQRHDTSVLIALKRARLKELNNRVGQIMSAE